MWFNFKLSKEDENDADLTLLAPISGTAIPIEDVPDVVFSEKIVGDGIAIKPTSNKVVAPCDCVVESIFKTKHALILKTIPYDLLLFIHIGIDTVALNGEPFDYKVTQGQKVKKGDVLVIADLDKIKAAGYNLHTPVVITNSADFNAVEHLKMGAVTAGEDIISVE